MGGIGSGRRHQGGKDTTEDSRPLDIRKLQRAGVLTPGRSFWWQWTVNDRPVVDIRVRVEVQRVVLFYRYRCGADDNWHDVEQPVVFDQTACTYGGARRWWVCPSCSQRVAILYGHGKLYACRHCRQLAYASQRETADDRALGQADKIRRRLGWPAGIANPKGDKPKGMHWRTFERLTVTHDACVAVSLAGLANWLESMKRRRVGFGDDLHGGR